MPLTITPEVDAIIEGFDASDARIDPMAVVSKLSVERQAMKDRLAPEDEDFGLWCEIVPMHLQTSFSNARENPWNSFFRPISSIKYDNGVVEYGPDIERANADAVEHWSNRARNLKHPVLKARYADVVWELGRVITKSQRRDVDMARIAVKAYVDAATRGLADDLHASFTCAQRAVNLASQIGDQASTDRARAALLGLHAEVMASGKTYLWGRAYDHLVDHKEAGTTDAEIDGLVADIESVLARVSDHTNQGNFDPHATKDAADRLAKHYTSKNLPSEVRRVRGVTARTFEFQAGMGNAMLAASFLQDSMDAYRQAGMPAEVERVRIAMQQKILESRGEMGEVSVPIRIPKEEVDRMVASMVVDGVGQTFANVAWAFVPKVDKMQAAVARLAAQAPLFAMISQQLISDNRVAAHVGSVEDDQSGHVLRQAVQHLQFELPILDVIMHAAREKHELTPDHFIAWANREGLFDHAKLPLLAAGVEAWFNGDNVKALHVLIPQVESALRKMVEVVGKPTTKAASRVPGASVAINMSDILFEATTIAALGPMGPDMALYLQAVYADPRGMNLRNEFAHGLLDADAIHEGTVLLVIHTLLVIGLWRKP